MLQDAGALARLQTRHVLLTGAAGFLSAHVLLALLRQDPFTHVHCLVRAPGGDGLARSKLQEALRHVGGELDWARVSASKLWTR